MTKMHGCWISTLWWIPQVLDVYNTGVCTVMTLYLPFVPGEGVSRACDEPISRAAERRPCNNNNGGDVSFPDFFFLTHIHNGRSLQYSQVCVISIVIPPCRSQPVIPYSSSLNHLLTMYILYIISTGQAYGFFYFFFIIFIC